MTSNRTPTRTPTLARPRFRLLALAAALSLGALAAAPAAADAFSDSAKAKVANLVTNLAASDCTSGYRCWRRESLARLPIAAMVSDGYAFLVEMLYEAKQRSFRIGEVPIIFVERRLGQSKLSSNVLIESLIMPWRLVLRGRS